jgi:deoxyribodipyrimidine photo-lyase
MKAAILWFRRDLRLTDNPALQAALKQSPKLIPVYIHAPLEEAPWTPGAASNWWLHHSLSSLDNDLRKRGSRLVIERGESLATLLNIAQHIDDPHLFWNQLPEPACQQRDHQIRQQLTNVGITCHECNTNRLMGDPQMMNLSGNPYRVFTPFWRATLKRGLSDRRLSPAPKSLPSLPIKGHTLSIKDLQLLPKIPWDKGFRDGWKPGEQGALKQFKHFINNSIESYTDRRDRPDQEGTSRLSPHLHFGEISPMQILRGIEARLEGPISNQDRVGVSDYLRQLGWREFAIYLLEFFPETDQRPFNQQFNNFQWLQGDQSKEWLTLWQQGMTGIPIVDAGMRELWHTGWMHNRVRMIVASLLTKNMGIHWLEGARWFWKTLLDADCPNNTLGWQWSAGCGADAAPYFRIFNPVHQGKRFDPRGDYLRRWIPELAQLSDKHLNAPWEAGHAKLAKAGIHLGKEYPKPIVDLTHSRKIALLRWTEFKSTRKDKPHESD